MGIIFGTNGKSVYKIGDDSVYGNGTVLRKFGNDIYKSGEGFATTFGDQTFYKDGIIRKYGDHYRYKDKDYYLMGTTLHGPGNTWYDVESDDDVRSIIVMDN